MQGHDKCLCEQPHLVQRRRDDTKLSAKLFCIEQHTANTKILQEAQDRGQTWGWCNFANMMVNMTQIIKYKHHCLMQVFILVRQTVSPISILTVPSSFLIPAEWNHEGQIYIQAWVFPIFQNVSKRLLQDNAMSILIYVIFVGVIPPPICEMSQLHICCQGKPSCTVLYCNWKSACLCNNIYCLVVLGVHNFSLFTILM